MSEVPGPSFQEVFGFPAPSKAEVECAAADLEFKFKNSGEPIGTQALFSVESLRNLSMDLISEFAADYANTHGVSEARASILVYAGFIGAVELMATIRLRSSQ